MRKMMLAAAAAVALLSGISGATAADVTGAIKSIDATAATITLDNGKVYKLPSSMKTSSWKVGEKVKVTFDEKNGQLLVSAITVA